jgi:hypothetical protein
VTTLRFEYLDDKNKFYNNWPPPDQKQAIFPRAVRVSMTLKNWGTIRQLYLIPAQVPGANAPNQPPQPFNLGPARVEPH